MLAIYGEKACCGRTMWHIMKQQYLLALDIVVHEKRWNAGIPPIDDSTRGVEIQQDHLIGDRLSKGFVTTSPFLSLIDIVCIVIVICYIR